MSIKLIEELTILNGVSGHENNVTNYLKQKMLYASNIKTDTLGNFIATYDSKKQGPTVAVVAHMDEVGLLVKSITNDGFIKVSNVGGVNPDILLSSQVVLHNFDSQTFIGTALVKSPHTGESKNQSLEELLFDFGFESKDEVLQNNIDVGDMITFDTTFRELPNNKLMSKAFDNRLGCAVICELDEKMQNIEAGKVFLCASVQEEMGLRGATTLLNSIEEQVDFVVVVDVSPVEDAFGDSDGIKIGNGCLLRIKDPRTILDYNEIHTIRKIAKENNVAYQNYFSRGGTDASMLQISKKGHITSAICIGGRNLHSQNSVISYNDYKNALQLIELYVKDKLRG